MRPFMARQNIKSATTDRTFNIMKAKKDLGYEPHKTLKEGIRETIE